MCTATSELFIGLTTFNHQYLSLSITGLSALPRKFTLVIYNCNPNQPLRRRYIRRLGYRGRLHIINGTSPTGVFDARVAIVRYLEKSKISPKWFMFINDTDVLQSADVPTVSDTTCAVLQSRAVIRGGLLDVLRILQNPNDYTIDGDNVVVSRPNLSMSGTLIRFNVLCDWVSAISNILPQLSSAISSFVDTTNTITDTVMWSGFQIFLRQTGNKTSPIYMDTVNMVSVGLDGCSCSATALERLVVITDALIADIAAAPCGQ